MRSTFSGLNTMVRGLNASQLSLNTVGHNITNANTTGYSRQTVNLGTTQSETVYGYYGKSQVGTGVDTISVTRARDKFADAQYWRENPTMQYNDAKQYSYDKIQSIFSDIDDTGYAEVLNKFYESLKTLSTNAGVDSEATRTSVLSTGQDLANTISAKYGQLQELVTDNNQSLELGVDSLNQITSNIADINKQLISLEAGGTTANDLRDTRDALVDDLSKLVNINVTELENGTYTVVSNGCTLVSGSSSLELATKSAYNQEYGTNDMSVVVKSTGKDFIPTKGALKGYMDSVTETKKYMSDMATTSAYLLTVFNEQHNQGYGLDDTTGKVQTGTDAGGKPVYTTNYANNFYGEDGFKYAYDSTTGTYSKTAVTSTPVSGATMGTVTMGTKTTMTKLDMINALAVNEKFFETGGKNAIAAKSAKSTSNSNDSSTTTENAASGANALILSDLLHSTKDSTLLGGTTLSNYYIGMITTLGTDAKSLKNNVSNQEDIMTQITNWRQSTSGVNWDEELTNMIKFQQAYSASSRCLTTMDEMLDKLINSTGTVGR